MRLELKEVTVVLNGKEILKDLSVSFGPGINVLLGENSSGKTTMLKTMAGLIKPSRGRILADGKDISSMGSKERAKLIGYCWQNPYHGFFEENVKREIDFILKNTGAKGREDVLDILGVKTLFEKSPFKLSGGEARRVSIASVAVADQPFLLMDEPFNDMDLDGYRQLMVLMKKFRGEGKTVVVSLNNALMFEALSPDFAVILKGGKIVRYGSANELKEEELERYNIVTRRAIVESLGRGIES